MTDEFMESIGKTENASVRFNSDGAWKVVLCNGMIRSASTWSYNVVMKLMRAALGEEVYGEYNEDISLFLGSSSSTTPYRVLKCHTLDAVGRALVESGQAKVVFTCRNLADAAVSFMRMFNFDFEHTLSALESSLELYRFHQNVGTTLILTYGEITAQPLESVTKISRYLGIAASGVALEQITKDTSLERARERVEQLKAGVDDESLVRFDRFVYDRETLLNLDHIRDGRSGYGREALTELQSSRIDDLAARYDFRLE
jgi:Sulfotransferase domain